MRLPEIQGLFLSGGQSSRMGQDKALLDYQGQQPEILRWKAVFDVLALPFYWSQRPGQYPEDLFPKLPRIIDQKPGSGPLAALLSAHVQNPEAAWFVIACDWPLLDQRDVERLLAARRRDVMATCYRHAGQREPLFCLYEPAFLKLARKAWDEGEESLFRLLRKADAWEVHASDDERFVNANEPDQQQKVRLLIARTF